MDVLSFLLKLLSGTARVGAVIALTALMLVVLVKAQIQPLARFSDTSFYQIIIVAGIVGFFVVFVEIVIALYRRIAERMRRKIIFIEQHGGTWSYAENEGVLQLNVRVHVTNNCSETVVISRPQLCLLSLARKRIWQPCFQLILGEDVFVPGVAGGTFPPRTLSVALIKHIHRLERPRSRSIIFLFEFRDQWKRRHRTRLHFEWVEPRRPSPVPN